jgi:hypothetical protein
MTASGRITTQLSGTLQSALYHLMSAPVHNSNAEAPSGCDNVNHATPALLTDGGGARNSKWKDSKLFKGRTP